MINKIHTMKHELTHIKTILDTAIDSFRPASDLDMTTIWEIWDGVVGEIISENAKPGSFRDGVLIVHVSSSVWLHQLGFLKHDMITNLNHTIGKNIIKQIKFRIASLHYRTSF